MTPNPAPFTAPKGSPSARITLGSDVFVWYRGLTEPFPAKVVVLNEKRVVFMVFWNRGNGQTALVENAPHASERRGATRESFWDFTPDASPPSAEKVREKREREEKAEETERRSREAQATREADDEKRRQENLERERRADMPPDWVEPDSQDGAPKAGELRPADVIQTQPPIPPPPGLASTPPPPPASPPAPRHGKKHTRV